LEAKTNLSAGKRKAQTLNSIAPVNPKLLIIVHNQELWRILSINHKEASFMTSIIKTQEFSLSL
jgi:hypothetical protein